jgi:hypothetical protein
MFNNAARRVDALWHSLQRLLKKPLKHHRLKPVPHFLPGGIGFLWHSLQAVVLHLVTHKLSDIGLKPFGAQTNCQHQRTCQQETHG